MEYVSMLRQKFLAQPSSPAKPTVVVGQQFCAAYPVNLTFVRKMIQFPQGNFGVTDGKGKLVFNVTGTFLSLRNRRILCDASGCPVVSLQQKIISLRRTWEVYRGDSTDSKDLLFTVKNSSLLQFKTALDVFLASNIKEDNCDFKVKGSLFKKSCTIYEGNSSAIIGQMHRKRSLSSLLPGRDKFAVTVYPNVDQAFIVAIAVILVEIDDKTKAKANAETKSQPPSLPS